jgi:hypothetical protein
VIAFGAISRWPGVPWPTLALAPAASAYRRQFLHDVLLRHAAGRPGPALLAGTAGADRRANSGLEAVDRISGEHP